MSGWYPHVRGHRTMFHMMQEDEPVLLKTLKDQGYFVWWEARMIWYRRKSGRSVLQYPPQSVQTFETKFACGTKLAR